LQSDRGGEYLSLEFSGSPETMWKCSVINST
jgi:hypothetical protein